MGAAFADFRLRVPSHVFGEFGNAAINTPRRPAARRFGTPTPLDPSVLGRRKNCPWFRVASSDRSAKRSALPRRCDVSGRPGQWDIC